MKNNISCQILIAENIMFDPKEKSILLIIF